MKATSRRAADDIQHRIAAVRARIEAASHSVGREPDGITIIAVSKTHPPEAAQRCVDAGVADLGENRPTELAAKLARVTGARWHFVGQLQRRQVGRVVAAAASSGPPSAAVTLVHSVDRRSLVDRIASVAAEAGIVQPVLVQVNVGDDPAKGGCGFDEAGELVAYARRQPSIAVNGLMTIPPMWQEEEDPVDSARPHFRRLRQLRDELAGQWPEVSELSMGMSADLEAAVEQGATMVRVGEAIFGTRGQGAWQPTGETRR